MHCQYHKLRQRGNNWNRSLVHGILFSMNYRIMMPYVLLLSTQCTICFLRHQNIITIWKEHDILNKGDFHTIQQRIEAINVPLDVGRIPYKIESGMSSLTADQWKNWTCIIIFPQCTI